MSAHPDAPQAEKQQRTEPVTRLPYVHRNHGIPGDVTLPEGWGFAVVKVPNPLAHQQAIDDPRLVRIGQVGLRPHLAEFILYAVVPEGFTGLVRTGYGFTRIVRRGEAGV
jgi:hypothetical protein